MSKSVKPTSKAEANQKQEVVKPTSKAEANLEEVTQDVPAPLDDSTPAIIDLPESFEESKPVTLAGKPVPLSMGNEAKLINTKNNRIITGFIDHKLAVEQTKLFPYIQILNEAAHGKK